MIIFLYGEDNYRLKQKVKALKEKFISASLGDTNLAVLDGATISYDNFIRQILAMPFLAKTRLVIVENMIKNGKKEILERVPAFLSKVPSSTILVFIEESIPDKRTALYKKLVKEKTEVFNLLDDTQLKRWIIKETQNANVKIQNEAVSKLAEYVGPDLWKMQNELDKLIVYGQSQITLSDVELLVESQVKSDIFALIDSIAKKNVQIAMKEFYKLINNGQNELYILTMIVYQYRNLLVIKDTVERTKSTNSFAIAKKVGLHPFVVQKSIGICQSYPLSDLTKIYQILNDYDFKIKTGKIESRTALELLIYRLTTQ